MIGAKVEKDERNVEQRMGDVIGITDLQSGGFIVGEVDDFEADDLFLDITGGRLPQEQHKTRTPHHVQYAQFVVTPKYQHSSHKHIDELVRLVAVTNPEIALLESKRAQLEHLRKELSNSDTLMGNFVEVYDLYETEEKTNAMEFQRSLGQPVAYGTTIQLKHLRSERFVTQSRKRAKEDAQAMQLSLVAEGNKGSWLQIRSADRNRTDGEHVHIGDQINLGFLKFPGTFMTVYEEEEVLTRETSMQFTGKGFSVADEDNTGKAPMNENPSRVLPRLEIKVDLEDDREVCAAPERLEVNASSHPYDFRIQLFRTWKTHVQWLEGRVKDDEEDRQLPVHGLEILSIRHGSDRVLYADPAHGVCAECVVGLCMCMCVCVCVCVCTPFAPKSLFSLKEHSFMHHRTHRKCGPVHLPLPLLPFSLSLALSLSRSLSLALSRIHV